VASPRAQSDADDRDARVDSLERIVGRSEERLVGGTRRPGAIRVELRLPEAPLVRLVADDEVFDLRERPRDEGGEGGELSSGPRRIRDRARPVRVDRERDMDAVSPSD